MIRDIEKIYLAAIEQIREKGDNCHAESLDLALPLDQVAQKLAEAKKLAYSDKKFEAYNELLEALNYVATVATTLAEPEWIKLPNGKGNVNIELHMPQELDGNPLTPAEMDAPDEVSLLFRSKAKAKSGFRYDYSHTVYRGDDVPVEIVDKICGRHFWMKPEDFMPSRKFVVCAHCALEGFEYTGRKERIDPAEVKSKRKLEDFGS